MLQRLLLIAFAGALGTLARYGLSGVFQKTRIHGLPVGTLLVNVLGCFLFGLVWTLADDRLLISPQTRTIVLVGFMGAFTTFSTFAFDTGQFVRDVQWGWALANLAAQNGLGLLCLFLGFSAGRLV